jgi:hypothetical protein
MRSQDTETRRSRTETAGWWYNYGHPIIELLDDVPRDYQLPRYFHDENQAIAYVTALDQILNNTVNRGRRSIGSVLSQGEYQARLEDGHPAPFPKGKPRYE